MTTSRPFPFPLLAAVLLLALAACNKDPITGEPGDKTAPILLSCSDLQSDQTLKNDPDKPIDYVVDCLISIGGRITVEPGTVIRFDDGTGLMVQGNGSLKAVGTSGEPIVFTAKTRTKGSWRGLYFETANVNNQLEHCKIEYAGGQAFNSNDDKAAIVVWADARLSINECDILQSENAGLSLAYNGTNIQFKNTRIKQTAGVPVSAKMNYMDVFDETSDFTGNSEDHLLIHSGTTESDKRVRKLNVPYRLSAEYFPYGFNVDGGVFTIDPGVVLEMGPEASFYVNAGAALRAVGTPTEKVVFTGADRQAGGWGGLYLRFTTNVNNVIEHAIIEYAGNGSEAGKAAITLWADPRLAVRDTEFRNLSTCAIHNYSGSANPNLTVANNTLTNVSGQELCWD